MTQYDYIFCGMGASASLLIISLQKEGLLNNKTILIIDKEKNGNTDKTFCFWSTNNDTITYDLKQIISHSWKRIELPDASILDLQPYTYNHVCSTNLGNNVKEIIKTINCNQISANIDKIYTDNHGTFIEVNNQKIYGNLFFDSRTPIYNNKLATSTHLFQSFFGWVVEPENEINNLDSFCFMDFNIEQNGFTQFVYTLPFSKKSILVEVTRFGSSLIEKKDAESILQKYCSSKFGKFSIQKTEEGCIPMSTALIEQDQLPKVTYLGSKNYKVKSSTGYAFKNMYLHAKQITEVLKQGKCPSYLNQLNKSPFTGRFAFYDTLLLDILKNKPSQGKPIFVDLLEHVPTQKILKFLDEKTNLREDMYIFSKLSWQPFISAALRNFTQNIIFRPLILLFLTILLFLLDNQSTIQLGIGYTLFVTGMLLVGLPHGAIDHLLDAKKWDLKHLPKFILKYLSLSAIMGAIWVIYPPLALMVFLTYSAWHFGQADGKLWLLTPTQWLLWGFSVLIFILGTHLPETNVILSSMGNLKMGFQVPIWSLLCWLLFAFYKKNSSFIITIIWLTISTQLPLIFSFGLYFIGQHSINGWQQIKSHLQWNNWSIWLHALPFHAAALIFIVIYYWLMIYKQEVSFTSQWSIFFIFLSCISFPHTIAMHKTYSSEKLQ